MRYFMLLLTSVFALAISQVISIASIEMVDKTKVQESKTINENKRTASGLVYEILDGGGEAIVACTCWIEATEVVKELDTHWLRRLAQEQKLVITNRRGFAGSSGHADLESEVLGLKEVIDAIGAPVVLLGGCEGAVVPIALAARYPERVTALIIVNGTACYGADDDYSGANLESRMMSPDFVRADWERWFQGLPDFPGVDPDMLLALLRPHVTGEALAGMLEGILQADVRQELVNISAPTLVIHSTKDEIIRFSQAQYLADHIKGARLHRLHDASHHIDPSYNNEIARIVKEFLVGVRKNK